MPAPLPGSEINQNVALETLSKNGKPPKSRLSNPGKTQAFVQLIIDADRQRSRKDANLKGMFDGNPPYNASKRRAASQSWRANFSSLEGKAYRSNALVPYYDLFSSTRNYIDFQTGYGSPVQQKEWSGIITEELDVTLKQWKGFDDHIWTMLHDFVAFGMGFLVWNNPWDWRFKRIAHGKVRVMDGSDTDLETLPMLVISQTYQVHELWNKIRNEVTARAAGWNPAAVKQAIRDAVPKDPLDNSTQNWEMVQQQLNDHDLLTSCRSSTIQAGRVYVKEFDGKITELIVTETGDSEFLLKKERRYASFYQVLSTFFLEVNEGSWHGCTGLGKDIFNMIQAKDKLNCSELDAAMLRGAIMLQAKSASAMTKIGLVQIGGGVTVIPPDFEVQQSHILGDISTMIAVNNDLDQRLSRNTGIYRASPQKDSGNPQTAEEAKLKYTQSTVLGNSAVNRFYNQLDRCYEEVARRITSPNLSRTDASSTAALDFQQRCFRRGVPKQALLSRKSVKAFRSMGNGSVIMRQTTLNSLAPYSSMWPETGQANFHDDVIEAWAGQSKVELYNPKADRMGQPTDQHNLAMLENAAMKTGAQVIWTPTQNNLIHAEVHLKASADAAASLSQGADPSQVLAFMENVGPHIAKHLQALSKDPSHQRQFKALEAEFKRLGQIADQLHGQVQKMMQQRQEEQQKAQQAQSILQGTDGDTAIKAAETKAKIAMATAKGQQGMQMKAEKHQQAMTQAQQDMQIKDAQAAAQIALEHAKAKAKTTE